MTNDYQPMLDKLARDHAQALGMGGTDAVQRHHQRGKLTCRERLDYLLDADSFVELGVLAKSRVQVPGREERVAMAGGVVIGLGKIDGRPVLVVADDATVVSGARGAAWPTASFSLMAPGPAINVVYQRDLAAAADPRGQAAGAARPVCPTLRAGRCRGAV